MVASTMGRMLEEQSMTKTRSSWAEPDAEETPAGCADWAKD